MFKFLFTIHIEYFPQNSGHSIEIWNLCNYSEFLFCNILNKYMISSFPEMFLVSLFWVCF